MSKTDSIDQLARAIDQTEALVAGIRPDQATLPTPCPGWGVRALVNHIVTDLKMFTARTTGGPWQGSDADLIGDDWTGAYRRTADDLLAAWDAPGALDRTVKLPFGDVPATWLAGQQIADVVVHGWDVATATGQSTDFDPELTRFALDWGRENLRPEFRGSNFGTEVDVPAEAPLVDQLVGFFGRDPTT